MPFKKREGVGHAGTRTAVTAEIAGDFFARIRSLRNSLWSPRRDFEVLARNDDVIAEEATRSLAAVGAVTDCLSQWSATLNASLCILAALTTIAGSPEYSSLIFSQTQLPVGILDDV